MGSTYSAEQHQTNKSRVQKVYISQEEKQIIKKTNRLYRCICIKEYTDRDKICYIHPGHFNIYLPHILEIESCDFRIAYTRMYTMQTILCYKENWSSIPKDNMTLDFWKSIEKLKLSLNYMTIMQK